MIQLFNTLCQSVTPNLFSNVHDLKTSGNLSRVVMIPHTCIQEASELETVMAVSADDSSNQYRVAPRLQLVPVDFFRHKAPTPWVE